MSKHAETDFVPSNINELMKFRRYIVGGLRGQRVPESEIDDRLQDFWIHCMSSNFFLRVTEKVDAGLMTPQQFRSYLGKTIRNCLVNNWKKENRNPAVGAFSTAPPLDVHGALHGTVDIDRLQQPGNLADLTIPADVVESDLIRYIADRKPAFLPTFILRLMGYRPADISRIIGKRKETIHYRVKALHVLVVEYLALAKGGVPSKRKPSTSIVPVYDVKGENPFPRGACYQLWSTLKAIGNSVTMREVVVITGRLMDQGKITTTKSPEEMAGTFVAVALEKKALTENTAPVANPDGGRVAPHAARTRYRFISTDNPYQTWGGSHQIFDTLVGRGHFNFNDLLTVCSALIDSGVIKTRRLAEGVAWGFIETARGYRVIDRAEEHPAMPTATAVAQKTVVTGIAVNSISAQQYTLTGENPYRRGINYNIWMALEEMGEWADTDVDVVARQLVDGGVVKTRRPIDEISYQFLNTLRKWYPTQCVNVD